MVAKWCKLCGSFLWNHEKQSETVYEKLSSIPIEYIVFVTFVSGMIVGAVISQIGG